MAPLRLPHGASGQPRSRRHLLLSPLRRPLPRWHGPPDPLLLQSCLKPLLSDHPPPPHLVRHLVAPRLSRSPPPSLPGCHSMLLPALAGRPQALPFPPCPPPSSPRPPYPCSPPCHHLHSLSLPPHHPPSSSPPPPPHPLQAVPHWGVDVARQGGSPSSGRRQTAMAWWLSTAALLPAASRPHWRSSARREVDALAPQPHR